jgi:hypothetical protein
MIDNIYYMDIAGGIKVQCPRCFAGQYGLFIGEMPEIFKSYIPVPCLTIYIIWTLLEALKSNIPGDIRGSIAKLLYNPGEG